MLKKNGKKLGVLGGMGPAAAAEFLRVLAARCPAERDQDHPIIYMIGNAETPDRSSAILGVGESPASQIKADLDKLCDMGADVLAAPCNTAHYFIDDFKADLRVPLIHIIEATVLAAKKINPNGAWMCSTHGTRECGLYQKYAEKHDYTLYIPNKSQCDMAQEAINLVKANKLSEAGELTKKLCLELWAERDLPIMTACTELPLGYDASGLPQEKSVSSIGALVDAVIKELYE